MNIILVSIIVATFSVATLALAIYGVHLYLLLWLFRRRVGGKKREQSAIVKAYTHDRSPDQWPFVTTQIPIYNEQETIIDRIRSRLS